MLACRCKEFNVVDVLYRLNIICHLLRHIKGRNTNKQILTGINIHREYLKYTIGFNCTSKFKYISLKCSTAVCRVMYINSVAATLGTFKYFYVGTR